jgi:hypothetical protein
VTDLQGRSAFDLFLNLPGGRRATLDYVTSLREFKDPTIVRPPTRNDNRTLIQLNPKLPAPPKGTKLALVRRTLTIDRDGKIRSTPLVDSIQLRVVRQAPRALTRGSQERDSDPGEQDVFEFVRERRALFAGEAGGLRAQTADDVEYPEPLFRAHVFDPFELPDHTGQPPAKPPAHLVLNHCMGCHSFEHADALQTLHARFPSYPEYARMPRLTAIETNVYERDATTVIAWKTQQKDWKALVELMNR